MKKSCKSILVVIVAFLIVGGVVFGFLNLNSENKIDKILASESYSYLPKEARNYVKEVYEKSGNVLLTEKNKKEGRPYLNPNYINYLIMDEKTKNEEAVVPASTIIDYTKTDEESNSLPSSYDLRNVDGKNYITPVRDQGNLGLCWAFASAGTAESNLLKTKGESYTNTSILISERQIDYATSIDGIKDYKNEYASFIDRNLGTGGNFYISTIAMANGVSLVNYNSFKRYNDKDLEQMELKDVLSYNKSLYEVDSTVNMPSMNIRKSTGNPTKEELETRQSFIDDVKSNIMQYGASYVGTYMYEGCTFKDSKTNNIVIDDYNCSMTDSHAMEIIGWNDDFEYSYCADTKLHKTDTTNCENIVTGRGAWILKNSWGEKDQYPYLAYDSLYTQISFIKDMKSSKGKTWDNNYILGEESENTINKEYFLSDTKIKKEEKLKKIKFITNSSDGTFGIRVLGANGNYIKTIDSEKPGLVTITFSNEVTINKDSKIIIKSMDGKHEYIDKVSIFTSNIDDAPYISLAKYENTSTSDKEFRLYSDTKNIPSGSLITYKIYDEQSNDVTSNIVYSNNEVAQNNVNTLIKFLDNMDKGKYKIDAIYNNNVVSSVTINYEKMQGDGTQENPYIIINSTQLDQIRNDLDAYYELGNDIDLTNDTRKGGRFCNENEKFPHLGCHGWIPIENFEGSFDGKGYTIKGLYENTYIKDSSAYSYRNNTNGGLFGNITKNVSIKNVVLEDFDITCHGYCAALASRYIDGVEKVASNLDISNIVVKNSNIKGINIRRTPYAAGLIALVENTHDDSSTKISNIYLDSNIESDGEASGLIESLCAMNVDINNIEILGNVKAEFESAGLISQNISVTSKNSTSKANIKNVIMTIDNKDLDALLMLSSGSDLTNISNVVTLNIDNVDYIKNNYAGSGTILNNVKSYDLNSEFNKLSDKDSYSSWDNFNENWIIKTVDGIPRIPVLKIADFKYTQIDDINISLDEENINIYELVKPKLKASKRILYKVDDGSILSIDEEGNLKALKPGKTNIHIKSLYDGYENDIPVRITYDKPYYIINYDSNGGTGRMNKSVMDIGKETALSTNFFTKEKYNFIGWNTKKDGTGKTYSDNEIVNLNVESGTNITLYAQWQGVKSVITFDPNGGYVSPSSKEVIYNEKIGEVPIPIRDGYAFSYWYRGSLGYSTTYLSNLVADYYPNGWTFVAGWEEDAYTIAFKPNGAEGYTYSTYSKNGVDKKLPLNKFAREGFIFKGWNTKPDGTGIYYSDEDTINLTDVENSLLNLYAIWEKNSIITNNTKDYEGFYDGKEHSIDLNIEPLDYNVKYSINNTNYDLDELPKFKEVGEYVINYKVTKEGYEDLVGSNKVKIYGIKKIDSELSLRGDILVTKNNDFDYVSKKITTYSNSTEFIHYDKDKKLVDDIVKTGDFIDVNINNSKSYLYKVSLLGDVNGDGKITSADYVKIRKHIMQTEIIRDNLYFYSADVNDDNKISSADYVKIRKYIMNGEGL